jgi:hypothetical protein
MYNQATAFLHMTNVCIKGKALMYHQMFTDV